MSHPEVLIALRRARDLTDRDFAQPRTLDSMATSIPTATEMAQPDPRHPNTSARRGVGADG